MDKDHAPAEPTAPDALPADPAVAPLPPLAADPDETAPLARVPGGDDDPFAVDPEEPAPVAVPETAPIAPVLFAVPVPMPGPASIDPIVAPRSSELASIPFLVVVTVVSLAADLVTKGWAKATLAGFDTKAHAAKRFPVWKDHIEFVFAQNPGGAWSFLRGLPDTLRRPFFLVVSAAAIVFIISIYRRVYRDQTAMRWGLPLALGGAMGNLVDRIRYGWVVDFIDFSARWGGRDHHWPTFNVADVAIVVGVALMGIDMARMNRRHPAERPAPVAAPSL